MSHPIDVRLYPRHRSAVIYGNPAHVPGPTGKVAAQFGFTSMERGVGMESLPSHINPERRRDFNFDLNAIFPNFMIHVRPGEYFTHQFWPLSPDRTVWEGQRLSSAGQECGRALQPGIQPPDAAQCVAGEPSRPWRRRSPGSPAAC